MDSNGNLSLSERRALRPGDWVVFQTEATTPRGEQRGRVHHVGESGIVWLGTTGSRYALTTDYVAMADWPRADAPDDDVSASEKRESFLRDIAPTRRMVAKWPAWKRNALGPVPAAPVFPPVAAPEPAGGVASPEAGKDAGDAAEAPEGREARSSGVYGPVLVPDPATGMPVNPGIVETRELRARVAALTRERDEARRQLRCLAVLAQDMIRRVKEVCGE